MQVLFTAEQIQERITELGDQISADYAESPVTIIGILSGCLMVMADLLRRTNVPVRTTFISASSYGGTRTSPGELTINDSMLADLQGKDVLLLDDIYDTGQTMQKIVAHLQQFQPASIATAVLLWKPDRNLTGMDPDYFGFRIPDKFVVGYGLDYNERFRELPWIGIPDDDDLRQAAS